MRPVGDEMGFDKFFKRVTCFPSPHEWQIYVATEGLPAVLPVPTGLGKTEGAVLAWAWRRLIEKKEDEPLHLVYCLPMRTLVRQTVDRLRNYFENMRKALNIIVNVYELMGGAVAEGWAREPDRPWIVVGTQDQLLSRALNRGYSMNRFEWPVHFGLLNHDCHWIIDEVQLMGPGLWTTAQLDWMRAKRFPCLKPCKTTWMSATMGEAFLATTDRKQDGIAALEVEDKRGIDNIVQAIEDDQNAEAQVRRKAKRRLGWFSTNKKSELPIEVQVADDVERKHAAGTLSLVVCNTVDAARKVFEALKVENKILLTSRFRRLDRERNEQTLLGFEAKRRQAGGKPVPDDPGLVCVSTQVIEAGLDISAHQLWSELPPWASVIQRLGRLNRDGRDEEAHGWFWETPKQGRGSEQERFRPYEAAEIASSKTLLDALIPLSNRGPFPEAVGVLRAKHSAALDKALEPKPTGMPRAFDVHGLFSTERDVHGGFTDVSGFVRGVDPDADLIVFWRDWTGKAPPRGDELDGPEFDAYEEGCAVPFFRLREVLKSRTEPGWVWNDEADRWDNVSPDELRPGMVVMLHRALGGYDSKLGWTSDRRDVLAQVSRPGRGRVLRDDARTEIGYWAKLSCHLADARRSATEICDALALKEKVREAVIEAAGLHDLGKAHPRWQSALPAILQPSPGEPWAKCPRVLAVEVTDNSRAVGKWVAATRPVAYFLGEERRERRGVTLRWAIDDKLTRAELDSLKTIDGVRWAGHVAFRPGLRHEAASALAMWRRYRDSPHARPYPALAVYLAAAHHGKVRTVLRAITDAGDDVFGVARDPDALELLAQRWPLDFSVAKDGAEGKWDGDRFALTGYGWTGLVADLLGPWSNDDKSEVGAVPADEPRQLGPFALAYLEALVRVADWRASETPSQSIRPSDISPDGGEAA